MKYTKPPLTCEEQADLLLARGMSGDRAIMVNRLRVVNYYRLSGYWYNFRSNKENDSFKPGTCFDTVWNTYVFDRRLRLLAMDAVERIEVAIRTMLAAEHSLHFMDPFAYAENHSALPNLDKTNRERFLQGIKKETDGSQEVFVNHFRDKYGSAHPFMPIWMATEVMTFGCVLTMYRGVRPEIRSAVAKPFGVHDKVLKSWLLTLNTIRNICAHHGRLWNRELGTKPLIPRKDQRWFEPVPVGNNRIFGVLTLCRHCLVQIAPQSAWPERLKALIAQYPGIPLSAMGFPDNWQDSLIWKKSGYSG